MDLRGLLFSPPIRARAPDVGGSALTAQAGGTRLKLLDRSATADLRCPHPRSWQPKW